MPMTVEDETPPAILVSDTMPKRPPKGSYWLNPASDEGPRLWRKIDKPKDIARFYLVAEWPKSRKGKCWVKQDSVGQMYFADNDTILAAAKAIQILAEGE